MPITDAERRAAAKYKRTKRKQIVLNISIDEDQRIKDYCATHNVQVATWIKSLIWSTINADPPATDPPDASQGIK